MSGLWPLFTLKKSTVRVFFNVAQVLSVQDSSAKTVYVTMSSGEVVEVMGTLDLAVKKLFNVSIDKPLATPIPSG